MDFFTAIGEYLASDLETSWLFAFWGLFVLFAAIEIFKPAFERPAMRRSRWPTNLLIGILNILLVSLMPVTGVLAASWAIEQKVGLFNVTIGQGWLSFFAAILLRSFGGYVFHVVTHKVPLLWRLHRVHHSDTHLDVTTSLRSHPAELVLLILVIALLAVSFGLSPWGLIAYEIAESLNNIIQHSNFRLPGRVDRVLRWVFVTPNMHVAHHSSYQPETDTNYGGLLSIWDRLFGTYTDTPRGGRGGFKIGLDEISPERAASFWWQLKSPVVNLSKPKD